MELERRQLGQTRELLWYAAWRAPRAAHFEIDKSAKYTKALRPDPERTCQIVVRHVEDSQIGKVAKLLGKAAYRKMAIIITKLPAQTGV